MDIDDVINGLMKAIVHVDSAVSFDMGACQMIELKDDGLHVTQLDPKDVYNFPEFQTEPNPISTEAEGE